MVEIDNWIKEQLKKGHKKEQIKGGLRKAGYPKNIINSVDSLARKRRNFNLALIFFVIIIAGIAFYLIYQNIFFNSEEVDTNQEIKLPPLLSSIPRVGGGREELLILLEKKGTVVNITSDGFEPKEMTMEEEQCVSFLNKDTKNHTIITNTPFKTREIKPTDIFIYILKEEGEFEFYFEEWPEIKGKVIITERTN